MNLKVKQDNVVLNADSTGTTPLDAEGAILVPMSIDEGQTATLHTEDDAPVRFNMRDMFMGGGTSDYTELENKPSINGVTLNTTGGNTTNYVQYVKVCKAVKNITRQPARKQAYEQIFYKTGRTETAV